MPVKLYSFVFPWYLNVKGNITGDWYADLGVKPLIHQSERRTYTKVVRFKETISFRFVVFWKILNVMAETKLVVEGQYIRIIVSPHVNAFNCILILYEDLDAWPINTEIPGMTLLFL